MGIPLTSKTLTGRLGPPQLHNDTILVELLMQAIFFSVKIPVGTGQRDISPNMNSGANNMAARAEVAKKYVKEASRQS